MAFGAKSLERLNQCDPRLVKLFTEVDKIYPCTILFGRRGKEEQNRFFAEGKSKLKYPESKHNKEPLSFAVDCAPDPVDLGNENKNLFRFYHFAGVVMAIAKNLGIPIRWGGDWDSDKDFKDNSFNDLVHFELAGE